MTKSLLALSAIGVAALAVPAQAQTPVDTGDESYNMVIVYGDDECPQGEEGEIVVCARQAESERFRIPQALRFTDGPQTQAWPERVERLEMVGKSGIMSCSPTGAGGFTGCTQELIAKAYDDKENASSVRFSEIIAEQRAERLSTIDEDAERTQAEVEMIEREYMERLEKERAGTTPDEEALPEPEAEVVAEQPEG
ncbi:hypothetical protein K3165_13360 [Qipengyuania sp. 1XM1-15A]|uniref:hypothetical protein n=1 Tax=Qipengyuania xiamenensis TaxID=2867237 RepID=UPI001C87B249|nr:hypothetical protein [Qipengyuania xiamenensis]MBX7533917.1 hypothetical protein [Qipengyuania xiamenensis]